MLVLDCCRELLTVVSAAKQTSADECCCTCVIGTVLAIGASLLSWWRSACDCASHDPQCMSGLPVSLLLLFGL
jgi:hypothetical protein